MKALRVVLVLVLIVLVVLEGVSGFVTGAALVVVAELVLLRWRLAGSAATHFPDGAGDQVQAWRKALGRALRRTPPKRETVEQDEGSEPFPGLNRVYHFSSLHGFDLLLRPRLAAAAAVRLADRHGVDIEQQPHQARRLLGEDVWTLLDPARSLPSPNSSGKRTSDKRTSDKQGGVVNRDQISQIVDTIESL